MLCIVEWVERRDVLGDYVLRWVPTGGPYVVLYCRCSGGSRGHLEPGGLLRIGRLCCSRV